MTPRAAFIGLGAQKAGTSWIYACMSDHPQLFMPFKEIHYFSRDDNYSRKDGWYDAHFAGVGPDQLAGEFCTSYLYSDNAPARIMSYNPDAMLIVCLRNPVDRAVSQYRHELRTGELDRGTTLREAIQEHASILDQGFYAEQLERYAAFAEDGRLLVLVYDDIERDARAFVSSIFDYVGVDTSFRPTMLDRHVNIARQPRWPGLDKAMHKTSAVLRRLRLQSLVTRVKHSGLQDRIYAVNTRADRAEVDDADRAWLASTYEADISKVETLTGRDLSVWRT